MVIQQGDVFWLDLGTPSGSAPGYRHPYVVVQNNLFNESRINTVVLCALTSNLARADEPGNVQDGRRVDCGVVMICHGCNRNT